MTIGPGLRCRGVSAEPISALAKMVAMWLPCWEYEHFPQRRGWPTSMAASGFLPAVHWKSPAASGQSVTVDLTGAATVQDVLDRINAVEPGVLTASVAAVGNGITLSDSGGTGPLSVADTATASALKLSGTVVDPNAALVGGDPNPQRSTGLLGLMLGLERALRSGDDRELARLGPQFDREIGRFSQVRADVSSRLKLLDSTQNRLLDRDVTLRQSLSDSFDADLTEVITQVNYRQQTLEATLRVSAQTVQLTLLNYL